MSDIQTIRFDGDNLQTVREGERVWVVVKRVCEALGVDYSAQWRRVVDMERSPWAVVATMATTGTDGKTYEMFCVDLDTLPMWLATLDVGRVKPDAREKLIAYQKECARVLRDHFFGRAPGIDVEQLLDLIDARIHALVGSALAPMAHGIAEIQRSIAWLMANTAAAGAITTAQHEDLQTSVRTIGALEVAIGKHPSIRAARADLYREMGRIASWGGKGQPWRSLPLQMLQPVLAVLSARRRDAEKRVNARGVAQLDLGMIGAKKRGG